jgi:hypothetical protein
MWINKTKTDGSSTLKAKTPSKIERGRILTPDSLQILVGASKDEVLIYQEERSFWTSSISKEASSWANKAKT